VQSRPRNIAFCLSRAIPPLAGSLSAVTSYSCCASRRKICLPVFRLHGPGPDDGYFLTAEKSDGIFYLTILEIGLRRRLMRRSLCQRLPAASSSFSLFFFGFSFFFFFWDFFFFFFFLSLLFFGLFATPTSAPPWPNTVPISLPRPPRDAHHDRLYSSTAQFAESSPRRRDLLRCVPDRALRPCAAWKRRTTRIWHYRSNAFSEVFRFFCFFFFFGGVAGWTFETPRCDHNIHKPDVFN